MGFEGEGIVSEKMKWGLEERRLNGTNVQTEIGKVAIEERKVEEDLPSC
jgi:hypothetical protein